MPKTYYLGFTKAGRPLGRASQEDYGYTHAAVCTATLDWNGKPYTWDKVAFSRSADGARSNAEFRTSTPRPADYKVEVVPVKVVTGKEYREAFKPKLGEILAAG